MILTEITPKVTVVLVDAEHKFIDIVVNPGLKIVSRLFLPKDNNYSKLIDNRYLVLKAR